MGSFSTPEQIFNTAAADFRSSLASEQREGFQLYRTPAEMIRSLQKHIATESTGKRSRLLAGCQMIDVGCKKFEPYFGVINILVQAHPEWACLVWGAIRMVFCVSLCMRHFLFLINEIRS